MTENRKHKTTNITVFVTQYNFSRSIIFRHQNITF